MVEQLKPEVAVMATGAKPVSLNVPGASGKNVVFATDVLAGRNVGNRVVIIGGRLVGLTTALYLVKQAKKVSVVTRSKIARGLSNNVKLALHELMLTNGVYMHPNSVVDSITDEGVNCWWDSGDGTSRENLFFFLPADNIVLAVGAESNYRLGDMLVHIVPEVYKVGDCSGKRSIFAAMRDGSETARKI
jgi:2-enoate reductase